MSQEDQRALNQLRQDALQAKTPQAVYDLAAEVSKKGLVYQRSPRQGTSSTFWGRFRPRKSDASEAAFDTLAEQYEDTKSYRDLHDYLRDRQVGALRDRYQAEELPDEPKEWTKSAVTAFIDDVAKNDTLSTNAQKRQMVSAMLSQLIARGHLFTEPTEDKRKSDHNFMGKAVKLEATNDDEIGKLALSRVKAFRRKFPRESESKPKTAE